MKIISFVILFSTMVIAQHDTSIVFLGDIDSTIATDVRYATTNNFTGKVLYPTSRIYTRKIVGDSLVKINRYLLDNYNLRIKIFDAFRPVSVQKIMWEIYPDPNFVADPSTGSRHNRGAAVDLTIIDSTGKELDMGTGYDNFTEMAHYDYSGLSDEAKKNRKLLRDVMIRFGFEPLETEWWHFDFKGWKRFSILDYRFN
ncbi:MAG: M15 family metallopeptidase [Melioribacteraceae bacterium]|nr:M15 family metallopeptidase [Melioribacteraceae bacterium]